jgi:hypothetical protein
VVIEAGATANQVARPWQQRYTSAVYALDALWLTLMDSCYAHSVLLSLLEVNPVQHWVLPQMCVTKFSLLYSLHSIVSRSEQNPYMIEILALVL